MKQYIRFKNIPTNEISNIYDGDLGIIGTELGTSCYEFIKDENYYKIILSSMEIGFLYDLIGFIDDLLNDKIPAYLIEAEPVGLGTYGEPVVKNIKIIKKFDYIQLAIPKPKYKMDKTNIQLTVTETIKNS